MLSDLTAQLDAPDAQYQIYLKNLQEWKDQRNSILGNDKKAGSINFLQAQITDLSNVPIQLKTKLRSRDAKVREIYKDLQLLVETYRSLYLPVKLFIEKHELLSGKFGFEFEALIADSGLAESFFQHVNQSRRGTFSGSEEGRKQLNALLETADLDTEHGTIVFLDTLLAALNRDKRETPSPAVSLIDQLKKGSTELNVLNAIFSLEWLAPRYSLKWSGKNLEQLSPGERGALLLIFYLLIDKRNVPLI